MTKTTNAGQTLLAESLNNPYRLFTAEELQKIVGKSINFVLAAKKSGAPFPGNVTRPEWFMEWLRNNPKFDVKSA